MVDIQLLFGVCVCIEQDWNKHWERVFVNECIFGVFDSSQYTFLTWSQTFFQHEVAWPGLVTLWLVLLPDLSTLCRVWSRIGTISSLTKSTNKRETFHSCKISEV